MARPRNPVPTYRKHRPSGQAVVTVDGRDVYLGKHGTRESKEQYERLLAELNRDGPLPRDPDRTALTIGSVVARYWRYLRAEGRYMKDGRPTSERALVHDALKVLVRLYRSSPAEEFGPRALKLARAELAKGKREKCRERKAVNHDISRIVKMFRWAVSEELVDPKVAWGLSSVAGLRRGETTIVREAEPVRPVPEADVLKTCAELPPHHAAMVMLEFHTAMRPGEVVRTCTSDLDRGGDVWWYHPRSHKTESHGIDRRIPLGPRAQTVLRPLLREGAPDEPIFAPALIEALRRARQRQAADRRYGDAARPNKSRDAARRANPQRKSKESFATAAYRRSVDRACRAAGVEPFSPNRLRHTALTRLRAEFGLDAAQAVAGHRLATTTEVYARVDRSAADSGARKSG